jgi:alkane 1-monooxygenase
MSTWKYLPSYSIPIAAAIGMWLGGYWTLITPLYVFLFIPLIEWLVGSNPSNHNPEQEVKAKASFGYTLLLWSYVPIQYALTGFFLLKLSAGGFSGPGMGVIGSLTGAQFSIGLNSAIWIVGLIGATLSLGISNGGIGFTVAHELIHRSSKFEQSLGRALLLTTLYMHFAIEHVYGHHKHVGTEEDAATARKGETFYRFLIRSVPDQYRSAWEIERKRLKKKKKGFWSFSNEMLGFQVTQLVWLATIFWLMGPVVALLYTVSCFLAFSLLEAVNYLEHYGLEREKDERDRYEKVDQHHSWNSDHVVSRMFLFELSRHSDHHMVASRHYQVLRSLDDSPQLPTGYPGMILLAIIPPLWFRVMNPLVDKVHLKQ